MSTDLNWAVVASRKLRAIASDYLGHGIMSGDLDAKQAVLEICEEILDHAEYNEKLSSTIPVTGNDV